MDSNANTRDDYDLPRTSTHGRKDEPQPVVHQHGVREETHACNAAIPSPPDSNASLQGYHDAPGAAVHGHHDLEGTHTRNNAVPEALDTYDDPKTPVITPGARNAEVTRNHIDRLPTSSMGRSERTDCTHTSRPPKTQQ